MILKISRIKDKIIFPPAITLIAESIEYNKNLEIIGLKPVFFKAPQILKPIVFYPNVVITKYTKFTIEQLDYCYCVKFRNPRVEIYYLKKYDKLIAIDTEYQGVKVRYRHNLFPYIPCPRCGINFYPNKILFRLEGKVLFENYPNYSTDENESGNYDIYDDKIISIVCLNCGEFEFNKIDSLHFCYFLSLSLVSQIHKICKNFENLKGRLYER